MVSKPSRLAMQVLQEYLGNQSTTAAVTASANGARRPSGG